MDNVTIKVIAITVNGQEMYVAADSCLAPCPAVYHPVNAIDFSNRSKMDLHRALDNIAVKGDEFYSKSGVRSETLPQVMEFEIAAFNVSRSPGRDFHRVSIEEKAQ